MARRMLDSSIAEDDRLNNLTVESMLLYLMTIPHLDRDGLIDGRSSLLSRKVAPLRAELEDNAPALIDEWIRCGLVLRYERERGLPVLWFKGFAKNQGGMKYSEQAASKFPPPPGMYRDERKGLISLEEGDGAEECETTPTEQPRGNREATTGEPRGNHGVAAGSPRGSHEVTPRQYQDQYQDQVVDVDVFLTPPPEQLLSSEKNARAHVRAHEAVRNDDGSVTLTDIGALRQRMREGHSVSIGELIATEAWTKPELQQAAYEMGAMLGLHMEWSGFEHWVRKQDEVQLWEFVLWCQFYADLPAPKLQAIESLPGLIRSHLRNNTSAPLAGKQWQALVLTLDRIQEVT